MIMLFICNINSTFIMMVSNILTFISLEHRFIFNPFMLVMLLLLVLLSLSWFDWSIFYLFMLLMRFFLLYFMFKMLLLLLLLMYLFLINLIGIIFIILVLFTLHCKWSILDFIKLNFWRLWIMYFNFSMGRIRIYTVVLFLK